MCVYIIGHWCVSYYTTIALQHPRVRYAACNAIGQMSTDFAPTFEKKFHDKVVPGLLLVLDDNANPRVQVNTESSAYHSKLLL